MKKNVLITGGTGFIGKHLTTELLKKGYSVSILSRNTQADSESVSYFMWDVLGQNIEEKAVLNADYIIHLAGENIGDQRWTAKRKAELRNSRINSAKLIFDVLKKHDKKVDAFVSASGIGFYGAVNGEGICTESTLPANDFIGQICQDWEKAADLFDDLGIRTVKIRTGVVLGRNGGIVKKLTPFFKMCFGSTLGSGKQYMPWIHVHDLCRIYIEALENKYMSGVFNATINDSTTNLIFTKTLASTLGRPLLLPKTPSVFIRLGLGEMAVMLLRGRRVSSDKIKKLGFRFYYKRLKKALKDSLIS